MGDDHDFLEVIDELEEGPTTEEIYELENIKNVYGPVEYNKVMSEVHHGNYDAARDLLKQYAEGDTESR